ncbi:latent-transforming growth factor beta-binding protein 2 isoform X2 [Clupea harengus]|uniref:Latent-transforming growth factor beta-binding protein 2 isoform X2 n=1 Tax=Clupea harengus TaxID=7950 RepID=A0A6P8GLN8_CLUHA|nr:latent-transforming growth factor beta-binding protein 2 isoform X2 [Clupea harengus]
MDSSWIFVLAALTIVLIQRCDSHGIRTGGRHNSIGLTVIRLQTTTVSSNQKLSSTYNLDITNHNSQLPFGVTDRRDGSKDESKHQLNVSSLREGRLRRIPRQLSRSSSTRHRTRTVTGGNASANGGKAGTSKRLVGPHVCGLQCCSGWAVARGTNRCIKPDCQPPCQNRGSCSRPHTCVCRSGFQGARCEEVAPEQVYIRAGGTRALTPIQPDVEQQQQLVRRESVEKQPVESSFRMQMQRPATTRLPHSSLNTQTRQGSASSSSKQTGTSRTVKRYPEATAPITSNALPTGNGHGNVFDPSHSYNRPRFQDTSGQGPTNSAVSPAGANLTSGVDRFKIVFTPMVCRRTCSGGRCSNSCERGEKTTVYTENNNQPPKSQGFRLFFCQIPCLSGGRCIGQNQCWCPSNSTGKFCHLPAPPPNKATNQGAKGNGGQNSSSHSTYTLPLSDQEASLQVSIVNVHIQHPPEAEVQVHQVARVKPGQGVRNHSRDGSSHSVQQRSQPASGHGNDHGLNNGNGNGGKISPQRPFSRQNGHVGRCFQETVDGQCGKPLPGLTKQDDCCGSVGASWGLNKCTDCPVKPAYAVIANGQVECPKGFKRLNLTHCQDINECLMPGMCKHAECLNTKGSYRCTCKPGYMLDTSRSHCVSDKAVSVEKDLCYRSTSGGTCALALPQHITKQICCCSRVGKAWGSSCLRCPLPDTDHFREICPAGHGYTYSRSDIQISLRKMEEEEMRAEENPSASPEPSPPHQAHLPHIPSHKPHIPSYPQAPANPQVPSHEPQAPQVPTFPQVPTQPLPSRTPQIPHHPSLDPQQTGKVPSQHTPHDSDAVEVAPFTDSPLLQPDLVEISSPPITSHPKPELNFRDETTASVNEFIPVTDIDVCFLTPTICGPGQCVSVQTGYTCHCDPGYQHNALQTHCIDINECEENPCGEKAHCVNTYGSYICHCQTGFSQVITQNRKFCQDVNECDLPNKCTDGNCVNTEGSYTCECKTGFTKNWRGQCEDVNECLTLGMCAHGHCTNMQGSYKCTCNSGYETDPDQSSCQDVDECSLSGICVHGDCINLDGSYSCSCNLGYQATLNGKACEDVNECLAVGVCGDGECLNTEGSFLCLCPTGYAKDGLGCHDVDECEKGTVCFQGQCLNTDGSYQCVCEAGYKFSADAGDCEDLDECKEYGSNVCGTWHCENTLGSYRCFMGCQPGFYSDENGDCDIDECINETICGEHGFCENTDGSYRCQCYRGYTNALDAQVCVDINECETSTDYCGEALCENVEGSFLCICTNENEEFDPISNQCRSIRAGLVEEASPLSLAPSHGKEMKECYYNLNDANFCHNVLSRNTTKEECCCTVGAGWGDNCEIHPCPPTGRAEYDQLCPKGNGVLPVTTSFGLQLFKDADECSMFEPEICKNGICTNLFSSYSCYCQNGYYYDNIRLECVDHDECLDEGTCEGGVCVNIAGSFNCFCSPPLILDNTRRRCISVNSTDDGQGLEDDIHMDICWRQLTDDDMCTHPLIGTRTTYTECCCLHGIAWGKLCAFCPLKSSEDFAALCNLPSRGSDGLRERPGYEYGPDLPPQGPFGPYWNNYGSLGGGGTYYDPEDPQTVPLFTDPSSDYNSRETINVPDYRPRENQSPSLLDDFTDRYDSFEGLRAEECGVLNGCENGRCVRVREGYTCDCFDGYELDLTKMACMDINECEDINDNVALCKNGVCLNTEGSYKCDCLPGFVTSAKPHECIPESQTSPPGGEEK